MVITGLERILSSVDPSSLGKVGLVANAASKTSGGEFAWDALLKRGFDLKVLFAPEHGLMASRPDGVRFGDELLEESAIPVISTYSPDKSALFKKEIALDTIVYDLQDVGARFYTFIHVLGEMMKFAIERGISFIVADRPNPVAHLGVAGPLPDEKFMTELAPHKIPVTYALTPGELASMLMAKQGETREPDSGGRAGLEVVAMRDYRREMSFSSTGLEWNQTSPAMPSPRTTLLYPGTCFFEGTNISEGRGTATPFEIVGSPWLESERAAEAMNKTVWAEDFLFEKENFTPASGKFSGELCRGIRITPKRIANPVRAIISLMFEINKHSNGKFDVPIARTGRHHLDLIYGSPILRESLEAGLESKSLFERWEGEEAKFLEDSRKFRIYD
jgi:uncharacterized protein YbbC (DUF1343 family)